MLTSLPIRSRLALLVVAVAAPFMALLVAATLDEFDRYRGEAQMQALAAARSSAARIDDFAGNFDALLIAISSAAAQDYANVKDNEELFTNLKAQLPGFVNNIKINSPTGAYLGSSSRRPDLTAADRDYLQRALEADGTVVGEPVISRSTGEQTIALARRVTDRRGKAVAVVSVSVVLQRLQELLGPGMLPSGSSTIVVDADGTVLLRNPEREGWIGRDLGSHPTVRRILAAREGIMDEARLDGLPQLAAHAAASRLPWFVYVGIPRETAYAPVWSELRRDVVWTGIVLLLAIVAGGLVAAPLTRSLRHLAADAAELEAGRLDHRPEPRQNDEIGEVAGALKSMAAALQAREAALKESERYYRYLFDVNPVPMWIRDAETMRILAINEAAVKTYGYSREEFLSLKSVDLVAPEDAERFLATMRVRDPNNDFESSWRHRKKDGSVLEVETVSRPFEFAGRRARLTLVNDVTERRRASRALRESEERLLTITDHVPALFGYIDSEERYRFLNKTYEDWFGEPREKYYGRTVREIVGEAVYAQMADDIKRVLSGHVVSRERPSRSTFRNIYAHFTYLPDFGEERNVRGFYVLGYDLTDRKKAEQQIAAERSLLQAVIANLPDQIFVKDLEGRYLLLNAAATATRGASRSEDLIGKTVFDLFPQHVAARFDAEDRAVMEMGVPLLNREMETTWPDGRTGLHLTTKVPLRDAAGRITGLVGINRNITALRRSAEEIRRLNTELERRVIERTAQLEAANKELESFSYSVSHDLRAPVRSIDGFSRALLEDFGRKLDDTGRDYLRRLRVASERMSQLIDDLLSLSRVARSDMRLKSVDMSALAREILGELQREEPARKVKVRVGPKLSARGDPDLLRVVLDNLVRNSWKFTGKNAEGEIEVGAGRQNGRTVYFVRDNGIGFDMAYAGKLFGAFQRLHSESEFPGTGIGLATVQRAVRRHGGDVWAEGELGKGATFYFTLGEDERGAGR